MSSLAPCNESNQQLNQQQLQQLLNYVTSLLQQQQQQSTYSIDQFYDELESQHQIERNQLLQCGINNFDQQQEFRDQDMKQNQQRSYPESIAATIKDIHNIDQDLKILPQNTENLVAYNRDIPEYMAPPRNTSKLLFMNPKEARNHMLEVQIFIHTNYVQPKFWSSILANSIQPSIMNRIPLEFVHDYNYIMAYLLQKFNYDFERNKEAQELSLILPLQNEKPYSFILRCIIALNELNYNSSTYAFRIIQTKLETVFTEIRLHKLAQEIKNAKLVEDLSIIDYKYEFSSQSIQSISDDVKGLLPYNSNHELEASHSKQTPKHFNNNQSNPKLRYKNKGTYQRKNKYWCRTCNCTSCKFLRKKFYDYKNKYHRNSKKLQQFLNVLISHREEGDLDHEIIEPEDEPSIDMNEIAFELNNLRTDDSDDTDEDDDEDFDNDFFSNS